MNGNHRKQEEREEPKQDGKMDGERRSITNRELAQEDNGDRDVEGNFVLDEEKPLYSVILGNDKLDRQLLYFTVSLM